VSRRHLAAAGIAGLLGALVIGSPAGAAPRLLSPLPQWVAPGVAVPLRVVPDTTGPLRLERRVPGGGAWRPAAPPVAGACHPGAPARAPGVQRLRLVNTAAGAAGAPRRRTSAGCGCMCAP